MQKTVHSNVELPALKNYVNNEKANRKISGYLSKHFENPDKVILGKVDDNVLAEYVAGDVKNKMLFDKKGNLIYTITYSGEKLLLQNYREMVDNLYADYKFSQVARVNEAARKIWVLKLETPKRFLTVRI